MNTTAPPWLLREAFTLEFHMLSDWHVGSGTGRPGSVDRLVARDRDDLPYLPAKTVTGIWRDALERLTLALDGGEEAGAWSAWVEWLFGSQPALVTEAQRTPPRPAAVEVTPARLAEALRAQLIGSKRTALRQALTFVKPGVELDPHRGQAQPEHLRFEEMARTGTRLSAHCTWHAPGDSDQQATASALLIASAGLVEYLGSKRRRGAGRCALTIAGHTPAAVLPWLHAHAQPPPCPSRDARSSTPEAGTRPTSPGAATTQPWQTLRLTLTLRTPLAVAAHTLGNVTETLDYVPGTLLLPHITRCLQALGYDCRPAVAAGMLQLLPATLDVQGQRGLPVPQVLYQHKMNGGFDKQGTIVNRLREPNPKGTQLKAVRSGYLGDWGHPGLPPYAKVPKVLLTHNTVEDAVQRPTSDVGGVYSREAIAAGAVLHTELRLHPAECKKLPAGWWRHLNGPCRLGVSRKDDYGLVDLSVSKPPQPLTPPATAGEVVTQLTVWLLSDVLLRDDALRPAVARERLRTALEAQLRVTLRSVEPLTDCMSDLIQVHRLESWHTGWGQPRPSLMAMAAGSCAVFDVVDGRLDLLHLHTVETTGIGERRGEGYGHLCFNAALLTSDLAAWPIATRPPAPEYPEPEPLLRIDDPVEYDYAQRLECAAWREALHRTVLGVAADPQWRKAHLHLEIVCQDNGTRQSRPSLSQLGRWRTVLHALESATDTARLLRHLTDGGGHALTALLQDPTQVWKLLGPAWQAPPTLTASRTPGSSTRCTELQTTLWAEAVRALVDACVRAHKRATEEGMHHGA